MKKIIFVLSFALLNMIAYCQNNVEQNKKSGNDIDWKGKAYMATPAFWESVQAELIAKIGKQKLEKVKKYSENENIPNALLQWDGNYKLPLEEYFSRLSTLKVSKLVEFNQMWEGKKYKYNIVSVPYQELAWDKTAKWDTIYYIVRDLKAK